MDLVWPGSQDSFPKEQAELRLCATASPQHSHHNQFGGSCRARATAVSSSEARNKIHLQSKPTAGPAVQPSHFIFAAARTGGHWGKVSGDSHSSAKQLFPAEKPQGPFLVPAPATVLLLTSNRLAPAGLGRCICFTTEL